MISDFKDLLDLSPFEEPLPGDLPGGPEPRSLSSSAYRDIRDHQGAARKLEQEAADDPDVAGEKLGEARGRWESVVEDGVAFLETECRDLTVAGFVADGWVRLAGLRGLRNGLGILHVLITRWWDHLHPQGDEDELAAMSEEERIEEIAANRGQPIDGLNARLPNAFRKLDITAVRTRPEQLKFWQRQDASLDGLAQQTGAKFYQEGLEDVTECVRLWGEIDQVLTEKCGSRGPGTSSVREMLDDCRRLYERLVKLVGGGTTVVVVNGGGGGGGKPQNEEPEETEGEIVVRRKGGYTRESAFEELEKIAAFFALNEPQSLIPAQLRKVIRWGKLSPEEFYKELIEDSDIRSKIFKLVGIVPKEDD